MMNPSGLSYKSFHIFDAGIFDSIQCTTTKDWLGVNSRRSKLNRKVHETNQIDTLLTSANEMTQKNTEESL